MAGVQTYLAFEAMMQRMELQKLVALLIEHGAIPQSAGITFFTGMAEDCRSITGFDSIQQVIDTKARHYEDMASLTAGGDFLPRDPSE